VSIQPPKEHIVRVPMSVIIEVVVMDDDDGKQTWLDESVVGLTGTLAVNGFSFVAHVQAKP
jgi:hypothetical protein